MVNLYEQAAQSMMQAGIGSLSGNKYDGLNSMMTTSPAGNNYYQPNFNVVNSDTTNKFKYRNNDSSGMMYSISDFINPDTGNAMSMSKASNAFAPFNSSARFVYPDGSGYEERGGNTYPIQLKGPQTWRINPGNNMGITNPNLKQVAGVKDWMKDKAWPWMKETGEGMKNQIPYLLDNLIPGYEPPEGYYEPDWEENKDMAGMDDSWQYLQKQMDELDRDSPNYEDQLELLQSDMDMKYPWMQMAELTQDQMNMMGNPLNTPDFGVSKEDLWNRVKDMEDKGFFGWGAQEPTTQEEFEDYYRRLQEGSVGNWVT